mgnify:CR=1 FL=1
MILASVLVFFNEKDRKIIIKIYESIWDKCSSMSELWEVVAWNLLPTINRMIILDYSFRPPPINVEGDENNSNKGNDSKFV